MYKINRTDSTPLTGPSRRYGRFRLRSITGVRLLGVSVAELRYFLEKKGKIKMKNILFAMIFMFFWIQAGYAHQLWVVREDGRFVVARGHMPDRTDAYNPACVKEMKGFDKNGNAVPLERKDEASRAVFISDKDISIITVWCDWGFRVNTTQGKKLMNRRDAAQAGFKVLNAFFSTQFLKELSENSEKLTKPLGLKLEIVPMKNPFQLASDESLPVQIFFDRTPLPDIAVSSEGASENIKTDKDGIALIKKADKGISQISARYKMPVQNNPEMDYHLFTAFLIILEE
jgi:nickel transport protein